MDSWARSYGTDDGGEAVQRIDGCHGSQTGGGVSRNNVQSSSTSHAWPRSATTGPGARTEAAIARSSTTPTARAFARGPSGSPGRSALADICEVTSAPATSWRAARHAQARQPGGMTNVDVNNVIRVVERIARRRQSGDGPPRSVSRRPPGQGRQHPASAGHLEPDAQCLQRHERHRADGVRRIVRARIRLMRRNADRRSGQRQ